MIDREAPAQRAVVIHPLRAGGLDVRDPDLRLVEAAGLAEALDLEVVEARIEPLREVRANAYFGSGKIEELKALGEAAGADVMVVDDQLTPIQQRNLEKGLNLKVVDRTGLILEIFARRARTREGRLQVELARLSYEKSRLVRTWTHLERQRGGTGKTGGPGERQIELDRRLIADKIVKLKRELEEVRRTRGLQRASRKRTPWPIVALVGYTNAGKSSLFNRATAAAVLAKDMPFATLDTTLRAVRTPQGRNIILSDTVGFITDLPTELIAAFRATLEEVAEADLLVHVRDIAHDETDGQRKDVEEVLERILEAREDRPPLIEAWNKIDLLDDEARARAGARARASGIDGAVEAVALSALTGEGMSALLARIDAELGASARAVSIILHAGLGPQQGAARAWLYRQGVARAESVDELGDLTIEARLEDSDLARFAAAFPEAVLDAASARRLAPPPPLPGTERPLGFAPEALHLGEV